MKTILSFVLILASFSTFCQNLESNKALLTNRSWKIRSDEMKRVGIHHAIPRRNNNRIFKE